MLSIKLINFPFLFIKRLTFFFFIIPDQWIDPPSETIKETIYDSIKKATIVLDKEAVGFNPILDSFANPSYRIGPRAHQDELNAVWQWNNSDINLFPCKWIGRDQETVWFYFTMASTSVLRCYILFLNHHTSKNPLLLQVGAAMESRKWKSRTDDPSEFEMTFKNYEPKKCK